MIRKFNRSIVNPNKPATGRYENHSTPGSLSPPNHWISTSPTSNETTPSLLSENQITTSNTKEKLQVNVLTRFLQRNDTLTGFDASTYEIPTLNVTRDTESLKLTVPPEFNCDLSYQEFSQPLCADFMKLVKFHDTLPQPFPSQVADFTKNAPNTRILLGTLVTNGTTAPSLIIFLNKIDFQRYTKTHPTQKNVFFVPVDGQYEWNPETRELLFKLPFGCFPTTSIMTTISYPSSKYGPRFPFPVVENERITLSDHDHHALLVKQQWRNFDGSLYKTKQTPRPPDHPNHDSAVFFNTVHYSCKNNEFGAFTALIKKIGPDFLGKDYTDSGYFLGQWGENHTSQFLRSNVSKLPVSVVFEADIVQKSSQAHPTDPTKFSSRAVSSNPPDKPKPEDYLRFYLNNAALFIGMFFLLYKIVRIINHKILAAQRAKQIETQYKTKQHLQDAVNVLFNTLDEQLETHHFPNIEPLTNLSIKIKGLPNVLLVAIQQLLLSEQNITVHHKTHDELTVEYDIDNIPPSSFSSSVTPLTELNGRLIELFNGLSGHLSYQQQLLEEEKRLQETQKNKQSDHAREVEALNQKESSLINLLSKLQPEDFAPLKLSDNQQKTLNTLKSKKPISDDELIELSTTFNALKEDASVNKIKPLIRIKNLLREIQALKDSIRTFKDSNSKENVDAFKKARELKILKKISHDNLRAHIEGKIRRSDQQEPYTIADNSPDTEVDGHPVDSDPTDDQIIASAPDEQPPTKLPLLRALLVGLMDVCEFKPRPLLHQIVSNLQPLLNNNLKEFQDRYNNELHQILTEARCDQTPKENLRKKQLSDHFHTLLETVIITILNKSDLDATNEHTTHVRRCLYLFLDLCFNDKQNLLETHQIVHHLKADHALSGSGHAAGKSADHLHALCFILNQFLSSPSDHASLDPINNLSKISYEDLKAFLESSWTELDGHLKSTPIYKWVHDVQKNDLRFLTDLIKSIQNDNNQCPTLSLANHKLTSFFKSACEVYGNQLSTAIDILNQKSNQSVEDNDQLSALTNEIEQIGAFLIENDLSLLIQYRDEINRPIMLSKVLNFLRHAPIDFDLNLCVSSLRSDLVSIYESVLGT